MSYPTGHAIRWSVLSRHEDLLHLLAKRSKHKFPLQHKLVRYDQAFCLHGVGAIRDYVQIDIPRTFVNEFHTSKCILETLKTIEKLSRSQGGVDLGTMSVGKNWATYFSTY